MVVAARALEIAVMGILLLSMGWQDVVSVALVDHPITFVSVIAIGGGVLSGSDMAGTQRVRQVSSGRWMRLT